ncbi:MAG: putative DNA binding domain-containing protein [Bacteroidales bacterium]|nr:putative DNA binding domain-containing protein [Bacteroidales bacterium]
MNKIETPQQIHFLLKNKIKPSIHLEYANNDFLETSFSKKTELLSLTIASIANSGGGSVLFGIKTTKNKPSGFSFPNTSTFTAEWFDYYLNSFIYNAHEVISVKYIAINSENELNFEGSDNNNVRGTIIAINISNSSHTPFMALDKRYYKRSNNKAVLMEEYEIRDLFNKANRTDIDLFGIMNTGGVPILENGKFVKMTFYPRFLIKNISSVIEKDYKVEFYLPSALQNANFDPLQQYFSRFEDEYTVFSITGKSPLFQNELATIVDAQFIVDKGSFKVFEENEIIIKIYYSSGMKVKYYSLRNTFLYKQDLLQYSDFAEYTIKEINQ